jgi:hypothetical protein
MFTHLIKSFAAFRIGDKVKKSVWSRSRAVRAQL